MKKSFIQYAMIATQWVPNNPIRAFLPFMYYYITTQRPRNISLEDLSKGIDECFELHLPYALLRSILEYLKGNSEASLNEGLWNFSLKEKNEIRNIPVDFESEINALIEGFSQYIGKENLPVTAEELISSFFARYDYEIMSGFISKIDDCDLNVYDYFFSEYVKQLEEKNSSLFNLVVKIAQGSLIKTAITSENLKYDVLKDKILYLDTKIIFRLLGYYGNYYKIEYNNLITTLKKHGIKIYVSYYVLQEIENILRGCIRYIESADYQYEKASDVLRYFRSVKMTKLNIEEILINIERDLQAEFDIYIDNDNPITNSNIKFYEDYKKLKETLTSKYKYVNDEFSYVYPDGIETDVKSVLLAYIKRGNNSITLIKNAPLFFVTTNATLIKSTMQYHHDEYGKTLSPIISDTLLGVICYTEDKALNEYSRLRLLTYCSEFYKPTKNQRVEFMQQVEKQFTAGKITDNDVFLLKHYELIDDVLVHQLRANDFNINDDCVFDALEEIHRETAKDVIEAYERKLKYQNERHIEEVSQTKLVAKEEIEALSASHEKFKQTLYESELNSYTKKIKAAYYVISTLLILVFTICTLLPLFLVEVWDAKSIILIVCALVLFLADLVQLIIQIRSNKILNKLIQKKAKKIEDKYTLN